MAHLDSLYIRVLCILFYVLFSIGFIVVWVFGEVIQLCEICTHMNHCIISALRIVDLRNELFASNLPSVAITRHVVSVSSRRENKLPE